MTGPTAALLSGGTRLHLQHGPIDLIIGADGGRQDAFAAAEARFQTVLQELVADLTHLRCFEQQPLCGAIAGRMQQAVAPHQAQTFVTPMAAVAGAVAETVLEAMVTAAPVTRAYVNNGGDIALHLSGPAEFKVALGTAKGGRMGQTVITADDPVRGIATSGQPGRSFSLGIADSVTVLATKAADADVAATLIANAVDLPDHPGILREPAGDLAPDSDLGRRLVVTRVPALTATETKAALDRGTRIAQQMVDQRMINAAALFLQGHAQVTGTPFMTQPTQEQIQHA
ncbi:MAG: UPF0280 family protein [Pseudomonadota bacterium]